MRLATHYALIGCYCTESTPVPDGVQLLFAAVGIDSPKLSSLIVRRLEAICPSFAWWLCV